MGRRSKRRPPTGAAIRSTLRLCDSTRGAPSCSKATLPAAERSGSFRTVESVKLRLQLAGPGKAPASWWPGTELNRRHADFQRDENPLTNDNQREPTSSNQQVPGHPRHAQAPLGGLGSRWLGASWGQVEFAVQAPRSRKPAPTSQSVHGRPLGVRTPASGPTGWRPATKRSDVGRLFLVNVLTRMGGVDGPTVVVDKRMQHFVEVLLSGEASLATHPGVVVTLLPVDFDELGSQLLQLARLPPLRGT